MAVKQAESMVGTDSVVQPPALPTLISTGLQIEDVNGVKTLQTPNEVSQTTRE